jgi:DNA-binding transcriptional LysR family regulator
MHTTRAGTARLAAPPGLDAFVEVATLGSIAAAARRFGETRSTVSRRLSRLEAALGVALLTRGTRRLVLTRAGEELLGRAQRILAEVAAAEAALHRLDDAPRGPLRVSIPPGGDAILGELFSGFLERFSRVDLTVVATDRHVDLLGEGFDAAIRAGDSGDPALIRRVVGRNRLYAVAAPAYLATHGPPASPDALRAHRCIVGFAGTDRPVPLWPLCAGGSVRVPVGVACNDLSVQRTLARAGRGIALLPALRIADDLADGSLVPLLPATLGATTTLSLVSPAGRLAEPQVRAFVEYAAEHLGAALASGAADAR